ALRPGAPSRQVGTSADTVPSRIGRWRCRVSQWLVENRTGTLHPTGWLPTVGTSLLCDQNRQGPRLRHGSQAPQRPLCPHPPSPRRSPRRHSIAMSRTSPLKIACVGAVPETTTRTGPRTGSSVRTTVGVWQADDDARAPQTVLAG